VTMRGPKPREAGPCLYVTPREMSFHPFTFPFSDPARIRQALSLQLSSLLGESSGSMRIHPVVLQREKDRSRGFALVFPGAMEATGDPEGKNRIFPAPLALGGALAGSGLGVWADEENVACVLWNEGIPVLYRCSPRADGEPGEVIEWILRSSGAEFDVLLLDARENPDARALLESEAARTWIAYPALTSLDLSSRQMDSLLRLEGLSSRLKPALAALLALGVLFDGAAGMALLSSRTRLAGYGDAAASLYREAFDPTGPVLDPLSQAKGRLAAVTGTEEANSLANALAMLGRAASSTPSRIVLDSLRFSEQQAELTGKGNSVESIRAFQQALGGKNTSLDDLQQLPGGQYRFRIAMKGVTP
jgi:hypothetical protein